MDKKGLKEKIIQSVDKRKRDIVDLGEKIYSNPETGFKEFETSALIAEKFRQIGLSCHEAVDIPAVKATVDTGKPGPSIAILAEMDSIICSEHPDCNKETGAAHACGHNVQAANMFGVAASLLDSGMMEKLSGKIHFIAVPAEEYIEVDFRMKLREKGTIRYLGGKPELVYRGFFDDVDLSFMIHVRPGDKKFYTLSSANGCLVKKIGYAGRSSHAGTPHEGINALYAANIGLIAINSIRETFREEECVRVHPIITKGGDTVNVIPSDVKIETYVRGKTIDSILNTNRKVDRALLAGAVALGARVQIEDIPGYFALEQDKKFLSLARGVMAELVGEHEIGLLGHATGSTDMGDLSTLMPVIHPYVGGVQGGYHSAMFKITDPNTAYILGSKFLACTVLELLAEEACAAKGIIENYSPVFRTKQEYFDFVDRLFSKKISMDSWENIFNKPNEAW